MTEREDREVLRLVVVFLRYFSDKTQADFGRDAQVDQTYISRYELGKQVPTEESLRRMAAAAGLPWHVVVQLRRFYAAVLAAAARGDAAALEGESTVLVHGVVERALLGVGPYFVEMTIANTETRSAEEERHEAAEVWAALERFPVPRRRRLIELSLRASRDWALAERICEASERAAAHRVDEALARGSRSVNRLPSTGRGGLALPSSGLRLGLRGQRPPRGQRFRRRRRSLHTGVAVLARR